MPLDNLFNTMQISWRLLGVTKWKLRLCWRPQTCSLTGKKLWGKQAYYGEYGKPSVEPYWVDSDEFILWQLKK